MVAGVAQRSITRNIYNQPNEPIDTSFAERATISQRVNHDCRPTFTLNHATLKRTNCTR